MSHFGLNTLDRDPVKLIAKAVTPMGSLMVYEKTVLRSLGHLHVDSGRDDGPMKDILPQSRENSEDHNPPEER
jgi:hypothetical protein